MISMELDGYDELMKALDKIEAGLSGAVRQEMVAAAGEVVRARAQQLCPIGDAKRGAYRLKKRIKPLRLLIAVKTVDYGKDKPCVAIIGPLYKGGQHAHLVEFGHRIGRRGTRLSAKQKEGWTDEKVWSVKLKTWVFKHGAPRRTKLGVPVVASSGRVEGVPFMRPAFDETKSQQMAAMEAVAARKVKELGGV